MTKASGYAEKAAKNTTLEMIGLTRSSSQEVAEGYGPSIQKSELVADVSSVSQCEKGLFQVFGRGDL